MKDKEMTKEHRVPLNGLSSSLSKFKRLFDLFDLFGGVSHFQTHSCVTVSYTSPGFYDNESACRSASLRWGNCGPASGMKLFMTLSGSILGRKHPNIGTDPWNDASVLPLGSWLQCCCKRKVEGGTGIKLETLGCWSYSSMSSLVWPVP